MGQAHQRSKDQTCFFFHASGHPVNTQFVIQLKAGGRRGIPPPLSSPMGAEAPSAADQTAT